MKIQTVIGSAIVGGIFTIAMFFSTIGTITPENWTIPVFGSIVVGLIAFGLALIVQSIFNFLSIFLKKVADSMPTPEQIDQRIAEKNKTHALREESRRKKILAAEEKLSKIDQQKELRQEVELLKLEVEKKKLKDKLGE